MAYQYSVSVRNAKLDAVEATIGASAHLKLFSGAEPANCAAADPAGLLATLVLPSDWLNAASSGQKTIAGSWTGVGTGNGTAASFRIYDSGEATCHIQGSVTVTGGGGDMTLDNTSITVGQNIAVTTFTVTAGNS